MNERLPQTFVIYKGERTASARFTKAIFGLLKNQREDVREDVREVGLLKENLICTGIKKGIPLRPTLLFWF